MDRRQFLATSTSWIAAMSLGGCSSAMVSSEGTFPKAPPASDADAQLNLVFQRIFDEQVASSPTLATQLGLDKDALAPLRSRLDTRPTASARQQDIAKTEKFIRWLQAIPAETLSDQARLNREVVIWDLSTQNVGPTQFDVANPQSPYPISQRVGAYFSVPDFLDSGHTIDTAADSEAYLSRLSDFATQLANDTVEYRRQALRGVQPPDWSIALTLEQIKALRAPEPSASGMASSIDSRARAKGLTGDWRNRAARIVERDIYPALDQQMATIAELRTRSPAGDGIWRLPKGDALYAAALAEATTTSMTAEEIHQVGLQEVASITAELDSLLRSAGYDRGSVGERLTQINADPAQLYANTDVGRAQLLADLNASVLDVKQRLPAAFHYIPPEPLDIRRVPPDIEAGASNGYYRQASLDGSRPAIYFINLKSTADWPKYSLPALTFHEGHPGHHLQLMTAQNAGEMPMLRRIAFYSAYGEGWALYAESVADELGAYKGIERAGFLQSYLFRAERLVVDTGIHHKRWTREQAIDHMVNATGFARPRVTREIERYITTPGQACSYKIGHIAWVKARQRAQQALGSKWDIRDFHEVLKEGAMPLSILDRRIDERVKALLARG